MTSPSPFGKLLAVTEFAATQFGLTFFIKFFFASVHRCNRLTRHLTVFESVWRTAGQKNRRIDRISSKFELNYARFERECDQTYLTIWWPWWKSMQTIWNNWWTSARINCKRRKRRPKHFYWKCCPGQLLSSWRRAIKLRPKLTTWYLHTSNSRVELFINPTFHF